MRDESESDVDLLQNISILLKLMSGNEQLGWSSIKYWETEYQILIAGVLQKRFIPD